MNFINPKTMNNSKGEVAVIHNLQTRGFVVNKPAVKNQPIYDLVVHLKDSIQRTAYIQVKTRGENNPNGFRIGTKDKVKEIAEWLRRDGAENYFVVLVDFFKNEEGTIHVMGGKEFFAEVQGFAAEYLSKPKKDGTRRKDTGAWTFEPKWSTKAYQKAKNNWRVITDYLAIEGNSLPATDLSGNGSAGVPRRNRSFGSR